jgi:molecular chaperone GrpE
MTDEKQAPETAPEDTPETNQAVVDDTETDETTQQVDMKEQTIDQELDERISKLESEIERNKQGWQRTMAEFQNYKRRIEREQQAATVRLSMEVLTKLLPIIDDFERAMANRPEEFEAHPWFGGTILIGGKFQKLLDEYNVEVIDPVGEPFDPNIHQAITMDDSDEVESGHVIETLQKGYQSGDHLLRPALVRVAN